MKVFVRKQERPNNHGAFCSTAHRRQGFYTVWTGAFFCYTKKLLGSSGAASGIRSGLGSSAISRSLRSGAIGGGLRSSTVRSGLGSNGFRSRSRSRGSSFSSRGFGSSFFLLGAASESNGGGDRGGDSEVLELHDGSLSC